MVVIVAQMGGVGWARDLQLPSPNCSLLSILACTMSGALESMSTLVGREDPFMCLVIITFPRGVDHPRYVIISSVLLSSTHSLPRPQQTRRFWGVFVNTFEQFIWKYGIMKDFPMKVCLAAIARV